jgi:hypothetical protein
MHSGHTQKFKCIRVGEDTGSHDSRLRIPLVNVVGIEAVPPSLQARWFGYSMNPVFVPVRPDTPPSKALAESQGLQFCPLRQENLLNSCRTRGRDTAESQASNSAATPGKSY